ncbi:MAG TPA: DNA-directed RNA polymerase subunit omega [Blastocatellia bacterium]|nr:DNA-directed RNA polymerase subunit omega [Blastocatellia bacterium]
MKSAISINKFLKVVIATQRAKQIRKGARALVQSSSARATRIAIEEVEQGLIGFKLMPKDPDLRSGRDNRGDRRQDDVGEDSREVTNQAPVTSQTPVARLGDQDACFFPIHRCVSLDPKIACHCSIIGMSEVV